MAVDFRCLRDWIKADRGTVRSQSEYGASIGLTQGQVSDLERLITRELSSDVEAKLKARFGRIPQIGDGSRKVTLQDVLENFELIQDTAVLRALSDPDFKGLMRVWLGAMEAVTHARPELKPLLEPLLTPEAKATFERELSAVPAAQAPDDAAKRKRPDRRKVAARR